MTTDVQDLHRCTNHVRRRFRGARYVRIGCAWVEHQGKVWYERLDWVSLSDRDRGRDSSHACHSACHRQRVLAERSVEMCTVSVRHCSLVSGVRVPLQLASCTQLSSPFAVLVVMFAHARSPPARPRLAQPNMVHAPCRLRWPLQCAGLHRTRTLPAAWLP